ncbi:hypothetical protein ACHAXS_009270 [Conticribra weissflogii]
MLPILPIHGSSNKSSKKKRPRVLPQSSNKKKKVGGPPASNATSSSAAKPKKPSALPNSAKPAVETSAASADVPAKATSDVSTDEKQPSFVSKQIDATSNHVSATLEEKINLASAAIEALFNDEISGSEIPVAKGAVAAEPVGVETTPKPTGKSNDNNITLLGSSSAKKSAVKPKAKSFRPIAKATKLKPKAKSITTISNPGNIASEASKQNISSPRSKKNTATGNAIVTTAADTASENAGSSDDALVLAAEAAAALLEGKEGVENMIVPIGLLEEVPTNVEHVAPALEGKQNMAEGEVDFGHEHDLGSSVNIYENEVDKKQESLFGLGTSDDEAYEEDDLHEDDENEDVPELEPNNNCEGPLGPISQVRSFETKIPQTAEVTSTHSNFLAYYYSNQAAEVHALEARRGSRKKRSRSDGSDSEDSDDSDEERSVVEEDSEEEKEKLREDTKSDDAGSEKDNAARDDNANQDGEEDGEGKMEEVQKVVTMKDFCSKYPKRDAKPRGREKSQSEEEADHSSSAERKEGEGVTNNDRTNASNSNHEQNEEDIEVENAEAGSDKNANEVDKGDRDEVEAKNDGPQVEVIDGQIVVAESSLLANPENRKTTEQIDKEFGSVVEDDSSSHVGVIQARYDSFLDVPRASNARWSAEETKRFYYAMRQCGTDFSMMQMIMPGRKRAQLKNKFKVESRKNPRLVDLALDPRCKIKLDLSQFGEDLEIPDEVPPIGVTPSDSPSPGASDSKKEEQSNADLQRKV